ncbi:UNVERIFIED_CONTAM: hypothetical protein RMT77_001851 [Armadillidium vulgare]
MYISTKKMTAYIFGLILYISLSPISTENVSILQNSTLNISEDNLFRGSGIHFANSKRKRQNSYFNPIESYLKLNYSKFPLNSEETFPYILPQIPLRNKFSKKHKAILWKEDILTPKSTGKEKSKKEHHNKHHHQHNKKRHYHHRKKIAPYFDDSGEYSTNLVERSLLNKYVPNTQDLEAKNVKILFSSKEEEEVTSGNGETKDTSKVSLPNSRIVPKRNHTLLNKILFQERESLLPTIENNSTKHNNKNLQILENKNSASLFSFNPINSEEEFRDSESNNAESSFNVANEQKTQNNVAKNQNNEDFNFLRRDPESDSALRGLKQMSLTIESYYRNHTISSPHKLGLLNDENHEKSLLKSSVKLGLRNDGSPLKPTVKNNLKLTPNFKQKKETSKKENISKEKSSQNSTNIQKYPSALKKDNSLKEYYTDSSEVNVKNVSQKTKKDREKITYQFKSFPAKLGNLNSFAEEEENYHQPKKTEEQLFTSSLRQENSFETPEEERCYSVGDLLTVIIMTSLINLTAGVIITLAFCCLTTRGRCISSGNRICKTSQGSAMNQNYNEDDYSGSVGCLEACLPDISYQRHIAKDISTSHPRRPIFGMNNILQHSKNKSKGDGHSFCKHPFRRSSLSSRRSLSMEDLFLT